MNNDILSIKCLDHGYVKLVDHMGNDLSIVRAARVSHKAEWRTGEDENKDSKLIKYMLEHNHSTPFEHVCFTFEVCAPIFVFRQWHRHRIGWSYNEESARYSEMEEKFYVPLSAQIGVQDDKDKQARKFMELEKAGTMEMLDASEFIRDACETSFRVYKELIAGGVPRELARGVLPVNTYSKMFATCNLQALFHFNSLRLDKHAQYEIRVYAEAMRTIAKELVPVAMEHWETATGL